MIAVPAIYFDGVVAADRAVEVRLEAGGLAFGGPDTPQQLWPFASLSAAGLPARAQPLRLASTQQPGARLVIADESFKRELTAHARQLRDGFKFSPVLRTLAWITLFLAAAVAAAWFTVQYMPGRVAFHLPDSWRNRVGNQVEKSIAEDAKPCHSPGATAALSAMAARIAEGSPDLPPVAIHVYDLPVMNAFALPGGRIVITSQLLAVAETPDEVAGVLAHELGHVAHRHPEAQLVRSAGLQALFAIFTGGGGSDMISQAAGLATILSYSRDAEAEADEFAVRTLTASAIDTLGLKHFFERVLKEEGKDHGATSSKLETLFATHPGTEERIKTIPPLPPGVAARPVMDTAQWMALKDVCRGTTN